MNYSFWEKYFIESPAGVTILGSGIVGLSTAISIKEQNAEISVKVLERGHAPYGASTKNAGFSCFGSVSELLNDIKSMGEKQCMEVVAMRWQGLSKLKTRVGKKNLEYTPNGGTELFRMEDKALMDECFDGMDYCNTLMSDYLGLTACYSPAKNTRLKAFHHASIFNGKEGTINPVSMMNSLLGKAMELGVNVLYGIEVTEIDRINHLLITAQGLHINYGQLIVCTNGFTAALIPELEVVPARNQVLMTKPIPGLQLDSGYHVDKGYIYFRAYKDRILLGGGRNLDPVTETTAGFGNTAIIQDYLKVTLEKIHPGASDRIDLWWSGILGVGPSKYPIVKWIDDHMLVGVRLGGMGVAIGSFLGDKLASESQQRF